MYVFFSVPWALRLISFLGWEPYTGHTWASQIAEIIYFISLPTAVIIAMEIRA